MSGARDRSSTAKRGRGTMRSMVEGAHPGIRLVSIIGDAALRPLRRPPAATSPASRVRRGGVV